MVKEMHICSSNRNIQSATQSYSIASASKSIKLQWKSIPDRAILRREIVAKLLRTPFLARSNWLEVGPRGGSTWVFSLCLKKGAGLSENLLFIRANIRTVAIPAADLLSFTIHASTTFEIGSAGFRDELEDFTLCHSLSFLHRTNRVMAFKQYNLTGKVDIITPPLLSFASWFISNCFINTSEVVDSMT